MSTMHAAPGNYVHLLRTPDFRVAGEGPVSRQLPASLQPLLAAANGCFAFANALHIFCSDAAAGEGSLEWWNLPSTWREHYTAVDFGKAMFFAEDIFGWQYAVLTDGSVELFDPVEGRLTEVACSVDDWARQVLADPSMVGYDFAVQWRAQNGALADTDRIAVYPPFAFRDSHRQRRYTAVNRQDLLVFSAELYHQLQALPVGADDTPAQ